MAEKHHGVICAVELLTQGWLRHQIYFTHTQAHVHQKEAGKWFSD